MQQTSATGRARAADADEHAGPVPDVSVAAGRKGFKVELDDVRERMRRLGFGYDEIAAEIARRHRVRPRQSYRLAWGWTLNNAAERFNALAARQGTDPQRPRAACPFGEKLVALMDQRGLSLREVARRVPCSPSHLSKIAHGGKGVPEQLAALVDRVLDAGGELAALAEPPARKETEPRGNVPRADAHGLSLSLPFVPGRVLIEISDPAVDTGHGRAETAGGQLALVRDLPARARQNSRR